MTRQEKRKRQSEIGAELLAARPPQEPWKRLEERYGLGRARLVELRRKAMGKTAVSDART